MRPATLEQFIGQESFIGPGQLLWRMLKADRLTSLIFYGPPGTGKTTLANVIAAHCSADFQATNATTIGVATIRQIIAKARDILAVDGKRTVLFLDEIHRFNKAQQDVLLDDVERGIIILIGATTENPFFSVNSALVSRSTIFEFTTLSPEHIRQIIINALEDPIRGLGQYNITITEPALEYLSLMANGDARKALTAIEVGVFSQLHQQAEPGSDDKPAGPMKAGDLAISFDLDLARQSIQRKSLVFDKDSHYDLASALQKSMRGSDPDATVYWLARLIAGGEDPRFIARRICITAAEDVGNADPMATVLAAAAMQIAEFTGFPEAQLPLAQAAIYIACAPKSNRCTTAIMAALGDVNKGQTIEVPAHLKDSHYSGAAKLGRGQGYKYPHNYPGGYVKQDYLSPDSARQYYSPSERGYENTIADYLEKLKSYLKDQ
jgi:putative ATPase